MRIIKQISEMQTLSEEYRRSGKIIGLVPTMGYLQHVALIPQISHQTQMTGMEISHGRHQSDHFPGAAILFGERLHFR
ncbi:MAG: hypothetical protein HGA23_08920, partial [Bacteroidales bacterium]|nr:hypothetical protein [Bacteroidales bacterium]